MLFNKNENKPASSIEEKIKLYRRQGHIVPPERLSRTRNRLKASAKVQKSTRPFWITWRLTSGKECQPRILTRWYTILPVAHGAIPAPLNYEGFPKSVCTSINEEVCHGIPDKNIILRSGDIINVDVSTIYNGYFSDASRMFMIGEVAEDRQKLVRVTKECLEKGIEAAQPWRFLGDVGAVIQEHAESNGYSVVREFCGHGVGLKFHEIPEVEHVGRRGTGMLLVPGMIFTIEPMINMGERDIFIDEDNDWTVITEDEQPSAQWENTILITETGNEILTW